LHSDAIYVQTRIRKEYSFQTQRLAAIGSPEVTRIGYKPASGTVMTLEEDPQRRS